jgi:hypothetical protein
MKPRNFCVVILLVLLLSVLPLNAQVPQNPPPTLSLSIHDDRLTVNIDHAPLAEVLAELARQADLRVSLSESAGKQLISRAFRDLPLEEGVERLLVGHSHAVLYEEASSPPGASGVKKIREIMVLSDEAAPSSQLTDRPAAREPNLNTGVDVDAMARVTAALQDPDPGVRLKALEEWAQHPGGYSIDPLAQALVDPDESVRVRAQQLFDHALTTQGRDANSPPPPPPPPALPSGPEEMPRR